MPTPVFEHIAACIWQIGALPREQHVLASLTSLAVVPSTILTAFANKRRAPAKHDVPAPKQQASTTRLAIIRQQVTSQYSRDHAETPDVASLVIGKGILKHESVDYLWGHVLGAADGRGEFRCPDWLHQVVRATRRQIEVADFYRRNLGVHKIVGFN